MWIRCSRGLQRSEEYRSEVPPRPAKVWAWRRTRRRALEQRDVECERRVFVYCSQQLERESKLNATPFRAR
ncbi:transposase, IS605 OrfB family protein [Halorubrum sp. AJ67]|nr:transposase, IS605 OrfB family protein [Halorubrum sp. AJ67]